MTERSAERLEWARDSEPHGPKFETREAPVRLIAFGAVPLSATVSELARAIGWVPFVVDPREHYATAAGFPAAEAVLAAWPVVALGELGGLDARTGIVALTHAPELDDEALMLALRSDAFYVGALGSRRTQGRRRDRLAAAGLSEAELARLSGPAGLDLGGRSREESGLAILAEAVACLGGREGGRLTTSANAIHVGGRP